MISIRDEIPADAAEVRPILEAAFGQSTEANIVDKLRSACSDLVALVAVENDLVVGHILFSPATIEGPRGMIRGMGLAPMAVAPHRQREGIGSALVSRGLLILRERRCPFIVVLGHSEYYPRFGFELASKHGLASQWEGVPDESFMVMILEPKAMQGARGVVRYRDEFDKAM